MALDVAYYNASGFFSGFIRGKIFLSKEMSGVKIFLSANLLKIADFKAKTWLKDDLKREMLCVFWGCFL